MLPAHAPPEFQDRSTLWNSVEEIEKSSDAQLAREIEVALPVELSRAEQLALVRAFVKDNFVAEGMCADFVLHDKGDGNPHAHIRDTRQNAVQWADLMAEYAGIQELTAENLNLLVERIEVFDRAATDDGVEQTIRICYRFGGYIGKRCFKAKVLKHPPRKKGAENGKALLVSL